MTRRGGLTMVDRVGHAEAALMAGQWAWARLGLPVSPKPFVPSATVLEIRSTGPILPLVRMPDGPLAAGFLAEGVEVNQVFGSLTEGGRGQRSLVEVPAGAGGTYTLVLTGTGTGPFTVRVSARYAGFSMSGAGNQGRYAPGRAGLRAHHPRREGRRPAHRPGPRDAH